MTSRLSLWSAALATALLIGAPRTAAACWDEHVTEVGPVRIAVAYYSEGGALLDCRSERTPCSTWAVRLARLLLKGSRLEIRSGEEVTKREKSDVEIELCLPGKRCRLTETGRAEIAGVFDQI